MNFVKIVLFALVLATPFEASAFWWLLRAGATRTVVGSTVRAGSVVSGVTAAEAAVGASRFCVRPIGATACDFRVSTSASDTVAKAVGRQYSVRATQRPGIFEVIDAAANVKALLESTDTSGNQSADSAEQFDANSQQNRMYLHPGCASGYEQNWTEDGRPSCVVRHPGCSAGYNEVWLRNGEPGCTADHRTKMREYIQNFNGCVPTVWGQACGNAAKAELCKRHDVCD